VPTGIQISTEARNRLLGKAVVIVALCFVFSYLLHGSQAADMEKWRTLTPEAYAADYEEYRAKLHQHIWPLWGDLILGVIVFSPVFLVYEGVGRLATWAVSKLLPATPGNRTATATLTEPSVA
jgi:hypothetical protein